MERLESVVWTVGGAAAAAAPEVEANLSPAVGPPATGGVRGREGEREGAGKQATETGPAPPPHSYSPLAP